MAQTEHFSCRTTYAPLIPYLNAVSPRSMSYRQHVKKFDLGQFLEWVAGQSRLDVHNVSQYIIRHAHKGHVGDVLGFLNGYFGSLKPEQLVHAELPQLISVILSGYNKLHGSAVDIHVGPGVHRNH